MPKKNRNQTTVGSRIRFTLKHCPPTLWLKSHLEFSAVAQPSSMGLNPASLQTSRGRSTQSTVIPRLYRDFLASFLYEKLNGDLNRSEVFYFGIVWNWWPRSDVLSGHLKGPFSVSDQESDRPRVRPLCASRQQISIGSAPGNASTQ